MKIDGVPASVRQPRPSNHSRAVDQLDPAKLGSPAKWSRIPVDHRAAHCAGGRGRRSGRGGAGIPFQPDRNFNHRYMMMPEDVKGVATACIRSFRPAAGMKPETPWRPPAT